MEVVDAFFLVADAVQNDEYPTAALELACCLLSVLRSCVVACGMPWPLYCCESCCCRAVAFRPC